MKTRGNTGAVIGGMIAHRGPPGLLVPPPFYIADRRPTPPAPDARGGTHRQNTRPGAPLVFHLPLRILHRLPRPHPRRQRRQTRPRNLRKRAMNRFLARFLAFAALASGAGAGGK